MNIDVKNILGELNTKGHYKFSDKSFFVYLEKALENVVWEPPEEDDPYFFTTDITREIQKSLDDTANLISDKIVSLIDSSHTQGYKYIWNGTEFSICRWHNDLKEGPNLFFLLYLTDMNPDCGGEIEFRSAHTKEVTGSILPKKYDIVIGSQELDWEHQVGAFKCGPMERITCNFGFYVKWT
jgi:hypothetical protein